MQVEYNLEWLPDLWDELEPLMLAHYREIDEYSSVRPLEINKQAYLQYAEAGILRTFVARDQSTGGAIGYLIATISPALHSFNTVHARVDALYLKPSARNGQIGYNMIKVADEYFLNNGVDEVYHSVPVKRNFGRLLERLGYQKLEITYSKRGN